MKRKKLFRYLMLIVLCLSLGQSAYAGFPNYSANKWGEKAVRKVLHTFAYGGHATDEQIKIWADMSPNQAVKEMLTFAPVNEKLSPTEDASVLYDGTLGTLEGLQNFWGDDLDSANPVLSDKRNNFKLTYYNSLGDLRLNSGNLGRTWIQAVTTKGINPFLHRVGFYLTNYHMSIRINTPRAWLMRTFYDDALITMGDSANMIDILAQGATSAALSRAYGHQSNVYYNYLTENQFKGNDDFAREFHQLLFKIQGLDDTQYHEDVTIEHTAWALTGMNLDIETGANGVTADISDMYSPFIDYTDHVNDYVHPTQGPKTRNVNNLKLHYGGQVGKENYGAPLEIYHEPIYGDNAKERIYALAEVAGRHPESERNMPISIIDFFADDNLSVTAECDADPADCTASGEYEIWEKRNTISAAWVEHDKNLLSFLQDYAASKIFHDESRVKYMTAFDRNLIIQNMNTISNEESFVRNVQNQARYWMTLQGADVFIPTHNVFGGQTGLQAANNGDIFKEAYYNNVVRSWFFKAADADYTDGSGNVWLKDWGSIAPECDEEYCPGTFIVKDVGKWLWKRFVADDNKYYEDDFIARVQVTSLLATGYDFGYWVNSQIAINPDYAAYSAADYPSDRQYSTEELNQSPLIDIYHANEAAVLALDSADPAISKKANENVGMAINFITITPYVFAMEGK